MKTGKSLVELAQALEYNRQHSRDLTAPNARVQMSAAGAMQIYKDSQAVPIELEPTDHAHQQLAGHLGIPTGYYNKVKNDNPALLAQNVNHWLEKAPEDTRMYRAIEGKLRAYVSSKYRRLDSHDLCGTVFPTLNENGFSVVSSELTETRMYIKAVTPRLEREVKKGDVVQYGLVISNSDVGAGSVRIEPLVLRLVCLNGMIGTTSIRKMHIGRDLAGDGVQELLTDSTLRLTDQAFWAQVNDVVKASMDPQMFDLQVERLQRAAATPIKNFDIPDVVDITMRAVGVDGEGAKNDIIAYLANGADGAGLTQWGLLNGFTYAAQNEKIGYDRAIELERAGAKVLDIDARKWSRISEAA